MSLSAAIKRRLRPLRRRINQFLGRDLSYSPQLRCETLRLGSDYGGWVIRPDLIAADSVILCFGAGEDISFDLAMIERFGVTVHAFDPTPKSVKWIKAQSLPSQFVFHPVGLADYDGAARFVLPRADFASYHITADAASGADVAECAVQRLSTIMQAELPRHARIDLLKMDIEGAEYAALPDILKSGIPVRQLLVEFHHRPGDKASLEKTRQAIEMLLASGYRMFDISPMGMEYSFVK